MGLRKSCTMGCIIHAGLGWVYTDLMAVWYFNHFSYINKWWQIYRSPTEWCISDVVQWSDVYLMLFNGVMGISCCSMEWCVSDVVQWSDVYLMLFNGVMCISCCSMEWWVFHVVQWSDGYFMLFNGVMGISCCSMEWCVSHVVQWSDVYLMLFNAHCSDCTGVTVFLHLSGLAEQGAWKSKIHRRWQQQASSARRAGYHGIEGWRRRLVGCWKSTASGCARPVPAGTGAVHYAITVAYVVRTARENNRGKDNTPSPGCVVHALFLGGRGRRVLPDDVMSPPFRLLWIIIWNTIYYVLRSTGMN